MPIDLIALISSSLLVVAIIRRRASIYNL